MYPIRFENLYYERIWGGRDLSKFRDNLPEGVIGESWDIACHKNGTGIVENGELKGKSFKEIIEIYGEKIVGTEFVGKEFPLLIKLINANDRLSVQVHPDDKYAKEVENDLGKTEAWYVVDAKEGAGLIVGTKDCTKESFKKAIEDGELDKYLNWIPVKQGDMFYVKSGLVHAICEGVTIAEIQQSSDTTYRVYDYNRGREIHVEKALDVIDFSLKGKNTKGVKIEGEGFDKTILCLSEFFKIEKYDIKASYTETSDNERFYLFTCVDGSGKIIWGEEELQINFGDSILIPAFLGEYTLKGEFSLLKSFVPNLEKEKQALLNEVLK